MSKLAKGWDPSRLAVTPVPVKSDCSIPGCSSQVHTQKGTCPSLSRGRRGRGCCRGHLFSSPNPRQPLDLKLNWEGRSQLETSQANAD